MNRYNIVFVNNSGNFAATAIAETVGGNLISNTDRYDGENDLAIIEVSPENDEFLREIMDSDDNIIEYR